MNIDAIKAQLTEVFRDTFDEPGLEISAATTADDIDKWDSLSHIDLILAVEQSFKIKLTTREVRSMKNVGDFMNLIEQKVS